MFADIKYGKKEFIPGAPRVSLERRLWVKRESAQILQRNLQARDKTKKNVAAGGNLQRTVAQTAQGAAAINGQIADLGASLVQK